jgi:uncharacterized protein (DUF488 family)
MDEIKVFTIGHSNVPASTIINLLTNNDIYVLVDVRSSPYSQYCPQFNRETFDQSLRKAGVEYRYAGDFLGGRPKDPSCYKDGILPDGHVDFLHKVDYPAVMTKEFFQKGIKRLLDIAIQKRTAVMCSEEDPAACHRHHLIGKYLTDKGITILHIRGNGQIVKDQHLPGLNNESPAEQLTLF